MGKILLAALVVVFMVRRASSVDFIFQAPSYTLEETYGVDNVDSDTIMISRSGTTEETNQQMTIDLSTKCRPGVTATASGNNVDITVPATVTFAPGEFEKPVPVTIKTDEEDELRELFCLTIETEPGSEYSTVIIIPGNDFCYDVNLDAAGDYEIASARYVGPWFTDISDVIEIWISPDSTATNDGGDIQIYLANVADPSDANMKYYGIFLDDSDANGVHGAPAGADGDSIIIYDEDATIATADFQAILTTTDLIDKTDAPNKFWLKYEQSSGTINLGTDTDRVLPLYDWSYGPTDALTVKHIFVSSVEATKSTYIKICNPASPRKINPVAASSSGYQEGGVANRAKDGERGPGFNDGNCFLSDSNTAPWLRLDLGQEYDVKTVLIWPVDQTGMGLNAGISYDSIDNAEVYVGSCDVANFQDNIQCDDDIDAVASTDVAVEVTCPAKTYGRYIYLFVDYTAGAEAFSVCEMEVYATEIPYGDETKVEFSESKFDVDEDNVTVTIKATRTGDVLTCTDVEFYTDSSTIPVSGNLDDFTATSVLTPGTFQWGASDANEKVKELSVDIDNDDVCEPYETFKVYLTNVLGGTVGAQSWATVGINDEDSVTFSLADDAFTVSEGDESLDIDVLRSGTGTMQPGSADLVFTDDDSATSADYDNTPVPVSFDESSTADTEQGAVEIEDDEIYEPDETFTVSLGRLLPPETCSMTGQYPSATVTITDNDSQFHWDSDSSITVVEGEETEIEITRDGNLQSKTVDVVIDEGTAEMGDDFSISPSSNGITSVTIPRNFNSIPITIETEDDSELENDETFTLTLRDPLYPSGNRVEPYHLTVKIRDNDGEYSWKQPSYAVVESSGSFKVCLVRTGYATDKSIGISTDVITASAAIGGDFTPPTSIDFVGGEREACADVDIQGDTVVESTETFTLTILSAQDVVLGANSVATVSITDDDAFISFGQPQYTFSEGAGATETVVKISKNGASSVSFILTVLSGTAILNTDFSLDVSSGSSITIPSSQSEYTIVVRINNDQMDEQTESFRMELSSPSTGTISPDSATTTIFITDDDLPPTEAPPSGIGGAAIGGIVGAAVVGAIVLIIAIMIFVNATGGIGSSAAAPATALPLSTYPPGYAGNGIGYGYGNGLNGYGYDYGKGLPNQGYSPYTYGPYR